MEKKELIVFIDSGDTLVDESTEVHDEKEVVLEAELFPGAKEALKALHKAGYRIALVADGLEASFRNVYRQHGLEECFEARAISETVGVTKPDAAMFRKAMELMQLDETDKKRIVMIGNNLERDIRGANGMGFWSILAGYSPRYRMEPECPEEEPDFVAEDPSQIPELVEEIWRKVCLAGMR